MSQFNNGGAIAIKGFNYQKATIAFIAIKNYNKDNFQIFVEAKEDFEVKFEGFEAYIQVKGKKLSLNKILSETDPILYKNLLSSSELTPNTKFKLITKEFSQTDIKKMAVIGDGHICNPLYKYSTEQTEEILNSFKGKENANDLEERLKNSYIYITPFKDKLEDAIIYLIGVMSENKIDVSNDRGKIALNELFTLIDQKSEFIVKKVEDYEKKKIEKKDLEQIFKTTTLLDNFSKLLDETSYNFFEKQRIKMEQVKILIMYRTEKLEVQEALSNFDLYKSSKIDDLLKGAIGSCDSHVSFCKLNEYAKTAIVLEVLIEMSESK